MCRFYHLPHTFLDTNKPSTLGNTASKNSLVEDVILARRRNKYYSQANHTHV